MIKNKKSKQTFSISLKMIDAGNKTLKKNSNCYFLMFSIGCTEKKHCGSFYLELTKSILSIFYLTFVCLQEEMVVS